MSGFFEVQCFRKVKAIFAGAAGENRRASEAFENCRNPGERVGGVGHGSLQVSRRLHTHAIREAISERAVEGKSGCFCGDPLLAVVADSEEGDWAGGIDEDIVAARILRGIETGGEVVARVQNKFGFGEARVTEQRRREVSGLRRKLGGLREDERLIAGFVVAVEERLLTFLWNIDGCAVVEAHCGGDVEDVLIVAREKEDAVVLQGAAEGDSELMLAVCGLRIQEWSLRVEGAVSKEVESATVDLIATGFRDDVDDGLRSRGVS